MEFGAFGLDFENLVRNMVQNVQVSLFGAGFNHGKMRKNWVGSTRERWGREH